MTNDQQPIFEARKLVKSYGSYKALNNVDFAIRKGEVIGLLGDNGAGKSTLVKALSGVVRCNSGTFLAGGKEIPMRNRMDSQNAGIETIYQDTAMVDSMSIARNLFLGREPVGPGGVLNQREMLESAVDILKNAVNISGIDDPEKEVGLLSGGQKQAVAIARAIHFKRSILLLDEPTSALSVRETEHLLEYVLQLKSEGISSALVTHNLYHAFQVCDRFVVMSRGEVKLTVSKADTTLEEVTQQVVLT
ncbi:ABC transporter ATP-binding protein [Phaeobacter inhibens]|uniref:ATP-binding cassette domain-containing protein n=1 Tax=Phaeobacter inhibens TaxID=221822 RepID=UPI00274E377C|nr:ATP-binding cassette domain-containing protein [Phaeobacter inhibens]GLO70902.1 ABC transporter ATP-binding protein [Phaeobacter inhibens]